MTRAPVPSAPRTLLISAVTERIFAERIRSVLASQALDPTDVTCLVPPIYRQRYEYLGETISFPGARYLAGTEIGALANRAFDRVIVLYETNLSRFQNVVELAGEIPARRWIAIDANSGLAIASDDSRLARARFAVRSLRNVAIESAPRLLILLLWLGMTPIRLIRGLRRSWAARPAQPCPLCASREVEHRYRFDATYQICRCRACTLYFQLPHPTPDELTRHFTDYGTYLEREIVDRKYRSTAAPRFPEITEKACSGRPLRILEIGSGNGAYLYNLNRMYPDWEVIGQEVDPVTGQFARDRSGCPVWLGRISELDLPPVHFDFVVAIQVLEHIPIHELKQVVDAVSRTLKPGGSFLGDLPNFASLPHSWLEGKWKNVAPLDHNSMLTLGSLELLLEKHGAFSEIRVESSGLINGAQIILNAIGVRDPKFGWMQRWSTRVGKGGGQDLVFCATR